ncbi:hypothetical protein ACFLX0_02320 [Chloroflexota bacterium]
MTDRDRIDPAYPYIDNKAKNLKGQITKLRNRIETLEVSGLQEQITNLNANINSMKKSLLTISREFAKFEMDFTQYHMRHAITIKLKDPINKQVREKMISRYAQSKEALKHSNEPGKIAYQFRKECIEISLEYKLDAFID